LLQAGLDATSARTTPFNAPCTAPSLAELAPHFPQLELLEQLGQGGMGAVYKARQTRLDRLVALKILPKDAAHPAEFANRFAREARAMARLSHPNIVIIHDYGEAGGWFFFIMEFVDGVNLRQAIKAKTVEPKEALSIVAQVCDALQYAHDESVVHRDIKPENILLDKRGRVKIADFGLAKLLGQTSTGPLTHTHQVMGTLGYMAPEQMEGTREVDHRADLYSVGVVFYELLTGELPMGRFAPPSQKVQVDVRIDEVVLKTLEKEPERRYQQASQIKQEVERITQLPRGMEPEFKRSGWQGLTAPGVMLLLLGLFDLLLLVLGIYDAGAKPTANTQATRPWVMLVMFDLMLGCGVALAGALMLWRKLWFLALVGSLLASVPLIPLVSLMKPSRSIGLGEARLLFEHEIMMYSSMAAIPIGIWSFLILLHPVNRVAFRWTILGLAQGVWHSLYPRFVNERLAVLVLCGLGLLGCVNWVGLYQIHYIRELPPPDNFSALAMWQGQLVVAVLSVTGLASFLTQTRRTRGSWLLLAGIACCALLFLFNRDVKSQLISMITDRINVPGMSGIPATSRDIISFNYHFTEDFALTVGCAVGLVFLGVFVLATARRNADESVGQEWTATSAGAALLGVFSVVLVGLGVGGLVWVLAAGMRQDALRFPFGGAQTSAVPWLLVASVLTSAGLGLLVLLLRGRTGRVPYRSVFVAGSGLFTVLAIALAFLVWTITGREPWIKTFQSVIYNLSEALGWIAGFVAGALVALLLSVWPLQLTRRFWMTVFIILMILVFIMMMIMPTSVSIQRG
jgi:hypothetical protein